MSPATTIPDWTTSVIIPPIRPGEQWKGFLKVDFDSTDDLDARNNELALNLIF